MKFHIKLISFIIYFISLNQNYLVYGERVLNQIHKLGRDFQVKIMVDVYRKHNIENVKGERITADSDDSSDISIGLNKIIDVLNAIVNNTNEIRETDYKISEQLTELSFQGVKQLKKEAQKTRKFPSDCRDIKEKISGQHQLHLVGQELPTIVYCHMQLKGGGWLVILNRYNGNVDFYQDWYTYVQGFGSLTDEYWMGLENIRIYMNPENNKTYELLVLLEDFDLNTRTAHYKTFNIGDAKEGYKLTIGDYEGDAGDCLSYANGMKFSTYDKDMDLSTENCGIRHRAGGWFKNCTQSNIFGKYLKGKTTDSKKGMFWETFRNRNYFLKSVSLLVRSKVLN